MNKCYYLFILIFLFLFMASCNQNASISGMEMRIDDFRNILPQDISEMFDINSDKYSSKYTSWQDTADMWINDKFEEERTNQEFYSNKYIGQALSYQAGTVEYLEGLRLAKFAELTNRFYERRNPFELMLEIKDFSDNEILPKIQSQIDSDEEFAMDFENIKKEEAIEHFTTDEVAFYFLWNYVIVLNRPRRFQ